MCECIKRLDAHLEKFNTRINFPFWSSSGFLAPFVETRKIDEKKRGKPRSVAASHCPFCGEKYPEPPPRIPQVTRDDK